jgi:hypothetical protein
MHTLFVQITLHQLEIGVNPLEAMLDTLQEETIDIQPVSAKRSLRELLAHTCVLLKADFLLMEEATEAEISLFYEQNNPVTIEEMKRMLSGNMEDMSRFFHAFSEVELLEKRLRIGE